MFHRHKFNEVQKDGFQYCQKCGFARKPECQHKFQINQRATITQRGLCKGEMILQQCIYCGELRNHDFLTYTG